MSSGGYRIRIYTPFFPFPPQSGAAQVIYEQARRFAAAGQEVELVFWKDDAAAVTRKLGEPHFKRFDERIFLTALQDPELRRVPAFQWEEKARGSRGGLATSTEEAQASRLLRTAESLVSPLASPEIYHYHPELDRRAELGPVHLAIYHYSFAFAWLQPGRVQEAARKLEKSQVVHLHNLESELARLRGQNAGWTERAIHKLNTLKLAGHEKILSSLVSELWFVSPADLARYQERVADAPSKLAPPEFDPDLRAHRSARYRGAGDAGFIGALDFRPNQDSLEWILREVLPVLKSEGFRSRFLIAGRGAPDRLRELARGFDFVDWLDFVEDAETFWERISILLSPHVSGSGTRIKLLEAVASDVPVLTNSAGVELLPAAVRKSELVVRSDDPREWARAVLQAPRRAGVG